MIVKRSVNNQHSWSNSYFIMLLAIQISAQVFSPEDKKKPFLTVDGEWNGAMVGKWADGRTERFVDVRQLKIIKKRARPIVHQEVFESRRLWKDVTKGLKYDTQTIYVKKFKFKLIVSTFK